MKRPKIEEFNKEKEDKKKETEGRFVKRKGEIEAIFDMIYKGIPTEDVGRKLGVAEGYIVDMVIRGKDGALEYWRKMYGL